MPSPGDRRRISLSFPLLTTGALIACGPTSPDVALVARPAEGVWPLEVTLDASASSDPENAGAPLQARFDFDGNGAFDTELQSELSATFRFDTVGRFTSRVEVRTSDGRTGTGEVTIVVRENTPPTAALAASVTGGYAPIAVELDPLGSTDPDQPSETLEARFDFDGDRTFDTEFAPLAKVQHVFQHAGEYLPAVEVRDRGGLTGTFTLASAIRVSAGADLDADANRDGVIDDLDEEGEDVWTDSRGAVFLANLDDDDGDGRQDFTVSAVVNDADLADMTPLIVRQNADLVAGRDRVTLTVGPAAGAAGVRVYSADGGRFIALHRPESGPGEYELDLAALATRDLPLYVEGVRTRSPTWDGIVRLRLGAQIDGVELGDVVQLRVAPIIFTDNLRPAEQLFVMRISDRRLGPNLEFYDVLAAQIPSQVQLYSVDQYQYVGDRWVQDNMQTGYQSMPGPGGTQRTMPVFLETERPTGEYGLEPFVPDEILSSDVGFVYPGRTRDTSLNYGGNLEVIPPHEKDGVKFPFGRLVVGGGATGTLAGLPYEDHMAQLQSGWLAAQGVQAPLIEVPSEWLAVGHIDEIFLSVPNLNAGPTERPWKVVVASPDLARRLLEDVQERGFPDTVVFPGRETQTTVSRILGDAQLMAVNDSAQARIDSVREILMREIGLTEADFVEVPVLYEQYIFETYDFAAAYNPGIQNLIVLDRDVFVPDPEGPAPEGSDVWAAHARQSLEALGLTVHYLDVFESYHLNLGEAHCGTEVYGTPWEEPWWSHDVARRAE